MFLSFFFSDLSQSLHVLKFIDNYLNENPLCVAYDEIATIKTLLRQKNDSTTGGGELKCLQKTSSISLTVNSNDYYYKVKFRILDAYPTQCIQWLEHRTNFPVTLSRFLTGQAKEISRKCVEPPLRATNNGGQSKFEAKPSLLPTSKFLIEAVFDFPSEMCPVCDIACLPASASDVESCDTSDRYVERVYCGHIYHLGCLRKYMREPPFPPGGKTCPAKKIHPRSDQDKGIVKYKLMTFPFHQFNDILIFHPIFMFHLSFFLLTFFIRITSSTTN